jgi:hypothetical protein
MRNIVLGLAVLSTGLLGTGLANAALHDRGRGLLYDDVLNVTWLQDANYAKTSGYSVDGTMNWDNAKAWADGLVYAGYSDWRLATNSPVNGTPASWDFNYSNAGTTDWGFNITSTHSELSYMYYVNLGLKGYYSPSGVKQQDYGIFGNGVEVGQANIGLVRNLQPWAYWSAANYVSNQAWNFYMQHGDQGGKMMWGSAYSWAVRAGDVPAIPEPETWAMLLAGLGLLGLTARRGKREGATG